jgi:hypothetical protein
MSTYTSLKGISNFGDAQLTQQLEHNLVEFFKWGLLGVGAFFNVTIPSSGAYGGVYNRLRPVTEDLNYTDGQVWEGFRKDWIWESGIEYGYQPIQISGVYVNNVFYPSSTAGTYSHYINYPLGQVVFNNAISTNSVVSLEYSYRWIQIYAASTVPFFQELMTNSWRVDNPTFFAQGSGLWNVLSQNRVQLPAVYVEAVPNAKLKGYQLGGGQIVDQDVLFHIFSEDKFSKDQLTDIVKQQQDKTIWTFDRNLMMDNNAYPLDYRGEKTSGAKCYPALVSAVEDGGYRWKKAIFINNYSQDLGITNGIYRSVVRATMQIIMPEI